MRISKWQANLESVFIQYQNLQNRIGVSDCMCFMADCVQAITGIDVMMKFRNKYSNYEEAIKLIEDHGGVQQIIDDSFSPHGFDKKPSSKAITGDVVLFHIPDLYMPGVIGFGNCGIYTMTCDKGLRLVPLFSHKVTTCWGIN